MINLDTGMGGAGGFGGGMSMDDIFTIWMFLEEDLHLTRFWRKF